MLYGHSLWFLFEFHSRGWFDMRPHISIGPQGGIQLIADLYVKNRWPIIMQRRDRSPPRFITNLTNSKFVYTETLSTFCNCVIFRLVCVCIWEICSGLTQQIQIHSFHAATDWGHRMRNMLLLVSAFNLKNTVSLLYYSLSAVWFLFI